jgi:hypothetical protein
MRDYVDAAALDEMPWPRWEFIGANVANGSIVISLMPLDMVKPIYDTVTVDPSGRTVDSTEYEATFDG